jgi:anti-anti-sigma regulatory factor
LMASGDGKTPKKKVLKLSHKFESKSELLVVVVSGHLNKENLPLFKQEIEALAEYSPKFVVVDLEALVEIDGFSQRDFVQFQLNLRNKAPSFKIRLNNIGLREHFKSKGFIRGEEVVADLKRALKEFKLI